MGMEIDILNLWKVLSLVVNFVNLVISFVKYFYDNVFRIVFILFFWDSSYIGVDGFVNNV